MRTSSDLVHRLRKDRAIRQSRDYAAALTGLLKEAAVEFGAICEDRSTSKVGVVGEIFLKFNPYAHKNVTGWLIGQGIEIVPPILTDFFMQYFVNRKTKKLTRLEKGWIPESVYSGVYRFLMDKIQNINEVCSAFKYYKPFGDIFHEADLARRIISLNSLFGEGWLLPAEIMSYYADGVKNVISLQPFGCIANHIVERGIENRLKDMCPGLNLERLCRCRITMPWSRRSSMSPRIFLSRKGSRRRACATSRQRRG